MAEAFYGDYGQAVAAQQRRRSQRSIANQQSAFLGQQRGSRRLSDIRRQYVEGFQPKMAEYGRRGLAGPGVQSGIQRKGLERYAADLQRNLGVEQQSIQDDLNRIAMEEANDQAELDAYISELNLRKQQDIINAATALRQFGA
jgi:hypothetical protein